MAVGAGDVATAGNAVVQARGVLDAVAVAEGLDPFVVAEDERLRVVEDHGVFVRDQSASGRWGDGRALEPRGCGSSPDGPARGRSRDTGPGFEVVVQLGDGVSDGPDGLDVYELVDAVAAAGGVPL